MTENKPIMIDETAVRGCGYYVSTGECANENIYPDYCSACSNCRYKLEQQLTAKSKKCEELKDKIKYMEEYTKTVENARNEFEKESKFSKAEKEQAEQKIEKIRQVCAETKDVGENIKDMYTAKLSRLYLKSRQILQIIDEVE